METAVMKPTSILALLNSNKSQRKNFCLQLIESIEDGNVDPLQLHIWLKNLEQIFKMLTDEKTGKEFAERYKAALLNAAEKEGSKSFEKYNAKFQLKESGVAYDWLLCNDPVLNVLLKNKNEVDAMVKERQDFLKAVPQNGLVITETETGETTTVYPPAKTSSSSVSVTLS